jgi:L-fuconolactonase
MRCANLRWRPEGAATLEPKRVLDSHIHITDCAEVGYRWEHFESIPRGTLPDDYFAAVGDFPVEAFVFVESSAKLDRSFDEARWIDSLARAGTPIAAIVAQADMRRGAAVAEELDRLAEIPLVRGVRWILEPPFEEDPDCCIRRGFVEATKLLPAYGYTLDISIKNWGLPNVLTLVSQCPDVSFVLDHIAKPDIQGGQWEPWHTQLRELAGFGNIVCKISGVPMEAGPGWSVAQVRPYVEAAADAFGPDRILFGSDYPAQHPIGTFASWATAIVEIMADRPADEIDRYFHRNALRTYRIAEPVAGSSGVATDGEDDFGWRIQSRDAG